MYYLDKIQTLKDIFATHDLRLNNGTLIVRGQVFPIVDDVIVLLDPAKYPAGLMKRMGLSGKDVSSAPDFSSDIQFTFGQEWREYPQILPEHKKEFESYFDLIDIPGLKDKRVCDLGCGIGRWSYFLKDSCRELVLVDFSEAIFVVRNNLKSAKNALFFMGDLKQLPFKDNFADFLMCIGVLHHLPTNALEEVRKLKRFAATLLIYLYYALDNRPWFYRAILSVVTALRRIVSKVRNSAFRSAFVSLTAILVYCPVITVGKLFDFAGLGRYVPLYECYYGKSLKRIKQDVYDRFFTGIEQRFTKKQILELKDTFSDIAVAQTPPYWHFLCKK